MPAFYEYGELQQQQQHSIPKKLWLAVTVLPIMKTADDEKLPFLGEGLHLLLISIRQIQLNIRIRLHMKVNYRITSF
jgi:hypothetical protein